MECIAVQARLVKTLCKTHNTITVNGIYLRPTLEVNIDDILVVNVINREQCNVTIYW